MTPTTFIEGSKSLKSHRYEGRSIHHAKDELEFATNWRRVFSNIYQDLKWLNAYALINHIALQKILKKFMKENFEQKDNVVDKTILSYINSKQFS